MNRLTFILLLIVSGCTSIIETVSEKEYAIISAFKKQNNYKYGRAKISRTNKYPDEPDKVAILKEIGFVETGFEIHWHSIADEILRIDVIYEKCESNTCVYGFANSVWVMH
ncbi:hypothetical protein [Teredinibacter sp. KSP-S5-2]|uniref:hypothetical protein n=1 Tax=Teredinibacter sp. KSP-S5-2 TaxID=3034506 RepID=UPI002935037C|nr:hypothetical protein [Teredinibacter sp. KSP-S5-2]WNO09535.1 hypothetical protein P5V12_21590 [Teredinibacter sp. KSP-S5-2]